MSPLPYQLIKQRQLIKPCVEKGISNGKSYGLSGAGYDIRIAKTIWLWPFWGRLAYAIEYFDMQDDVLAIVHDKSSWARRMVFVQNTVIEPGWKGYLTLELTRFKPWPIRIKEGTPIAQIIFHQLVLPTEKPYTGKYQNQAAKAVPFIYEKPEEQCSTRTYTDMLPSLLLKIKRRHLAYSVRSSEQKKKSTINIIILLWLSLLSLLGSLLYLYLSQSQMLG